MNTIITENATSVINPEVTATPAATTAVESAKAPDKKAIVITAAAVGGGIVGGVLVGRQITKYANSRAAFRGLMDEIQEILYGESCKDLPDSIRISTYHDAAKQCEELASQIPMFHNRASEVAYHQAAAIIYQNAANLAASSHAAFSGRTALLENFEHMAKWHENMAERLEQIICDDSLLNRVVGGFWRSIRQPMSNRSIRKKHQPGAVTDEDEDDTTV